ncbi:MAG: hypothetical protein WC332_06835, partial [Clostridia bacterium]
TDSNILNKYLLDCEKRLGNSIKITTKITNDDNAKKIRDASVESILKEKPSIILPVQEETDNEMTEEKKITRICELDSNSYKVYIEGTINYVKEYKSETVHMFEFGLNDLSGSIVCKKFFSKDDTKIEKYESLIIENKFISVTGKHQIEKNSPKYFINVDSVSEIKLSNRTDKAKVKRVEMNIDTDKINIDLLFETLTKWKHEAFGIMPKDNINSFVEVHKRNLVNKYKLKPIYGITIKVLMDDHSAVFNPNKTLITENICSGQIKEDNIYISDICYKDIKKTEVFKKNDFIGIRNFCDHKALYVFTEADNDEISAHIAKSGITVVDVKKVFEILEKKTFTLNSLMLKLNSSNDNFVSAAYNSAELLKSMFESYEEICILTANLNMQNENLNVYPVSLTVMNYEGLRNLYKILTKRNCLWKIVPRSYLEAHRYGLLIGSSDTEGELYSLLFNDADTETIYSKTVFYDYINLLSDRHAELLKESKIIKSINEFRNFNKFLYKCSTECGVIPIATCFSKDISKRELMITNELITEFSYLENENAKKTVIENTRRLIMEIESVVPITKANNIDDIVSNAFLDGYNDMSEQFKKEFTYITSQKISGIMTLIKDLILRLKEKDILFQIESVQTPYILSRIFNDIDYLSINTDNFKIHIQSDMIIDVFEILNSISKNYNPFFVKYDTYTAVHLLPYSNCIYDFTPMLIKGNEMVTQYDADVLKDYFPTIFIQPDMDLLMIKNLYKLTNIIPTSDQIEILDYTDMDFYTSDVKVKDVLNMIKPASKNEFVRCIGLIYGKGIWYNNAERLIHEKLAEIYDVICFKYEFSDESKNSEMYKESKRKIKECITYEEALVHLKNITMLKWYYINYPKQFKLEYINRYRDLTRFGQEFSVKPADINLSQKDRYLNDESFQSITEPLDIIPYIDDETMNKIISNRPYSSVDDFAIRNSIGDDILKKIKNDGYLSSLNKSDQIDIMDLFE